MLDDTAAGSLTVVAFNPASAGLSFVDPSTTFLLSRVTARFADIGLHTRVKAVREISRGWR
jgi:hypothetical protein